MATIPGLPGPSRLSAGGGLDAGAPPASPRDFGQGRFRDLYNLGQATLGAGNAALDFGVRREHAKADEAYLAVSEQMDLDRIELSRLTGRSAENAPAELDRRTREHLKEAGKGLNSPWARERFQRRFGERYRLNRLWAEKHAFEQGMEADRRTFLQSAALRLRDAKANPGSLPHLLKDSEANIREFYAGEDEEFLAAKAAVDNADLAEAAVNSLGEASPAEALRMLDDDGVRSALGAKRTRELGNVYARMRRAASNAFVADRLGEERDEEDELYDAVEEALPDADDAERESVRKRAASRIKSRRSAKARERRELEDTAVQAMRAAEWNADAIDPNWPDDLQEKMLDKSEKELTKANTAMQRREKAERKARGLEYLKLSPDELDRKILAGEWTSMLDAVGADSPEGKKLLALVNKDNPARRSAIGGRSGRTMLQYASSEYERLVGNPRSQKKKPDFVKFIERVEEERDALAEELGVDPQLIPNGKQKEIIDKHLMNGDWRWFDDFPFGDPEGAE